MLFITSGKTSFNIDRELKRGFNQKFIKNFVN